MWRQGVHFQPEDPSPRRIFVPCFQMYDKPILFRLFEFDSGFSESDDIGREDGVDDGRIDDDVEGSEFIQQLAKVLLTLFWRGIVDVWTEDVWKVYFFYC